MKKPNLVLLFCLFSLSLVAHDATKNKRYMIARSSKDVEKDWEVVSGSPVSHQFLQTYENLCKSKRKMPIIDQISLLVTKNKVDAEDILRFKASLLPEFKRDEKKRCN